MLINSIFPVCSAATVVYFKDGRANEIISITGIVLMNFSENLYIPETETENLLETFWDTRC